MSTAVELAAKRKAMLRAMDRSALETLLLQQLVSGTLSDVDLTLAASCSDVNSLGLLEGLSDDLLLRVMGQLDTKTRLHACTVVCKRLRALHFSVSLWRDIRLSPEWINDDGLRKLAHWLPDRGAVRSLTLERYNWGEAAAHEFVASFGGLQSLTLSGAIKTHLAYSFSRLKFSSLREFCFDPMGNMGDQNVVRMLAGMPALRVLKLCESQLTDKMILSVAMTRHGMANAHPVVGPPSSRKNGNVPPTAVLCPDLEELIQIGAAKWNDKLSEIGLAILGKAFPCLRVLRTCVSIREPCAQFEMKPPLPDLVTLEILRLCPFSGPHLSAMCVNALMTGLLKGCPAVRHFAFRHGRKYMGQLEVKREGGYPPPPPLALESLLWCAPSCLQTLELGYFHIAIGGHYRRVLPDLVKLKCIDCPGSAELAACLQAGGVLQQSGCESIETAKRRDGSLIKWW